MIFHIFLCVLPTSNVSLPLLNGNILFKKEMKDRELTEKIILEAVGSIIENDGFEKLGVNAIAQRAGVSKVLIYRYFGGIDELIAQYLLQKDYWANTDMNIIKPSDIGGSLKRLFREQVIRLRNDITLKRLCRWELSTENENIRCLREKREQNGCNLIKRVSQLTCSQNSEVASLASIISASISYLALMEERNPIITVSTCEAITDGNR